MAEGGSILDSLWQWVSPRSAEAKMRGTPEAMDLVSDLWAEAEQGRPAYLPEMYSRIYRAAEARPEVVHIRPEQALWDRNQIMGMYSPPEPLNRQHRIVYAPTTDPALGERSVENTLPHELLHFLNQTSGRPQTSPVQHDLIYQLIGGKLFGPRATGSLGGLPPVPFTPMEQALLERWFQTPGTPPRATER